MTRDTAKSRLSEKPGVYKSVHIMEKYLDKRADGKSGFYYINYPVPPELQRELGRRYERKSTGTNNLRDARRIAAELAALFEKKFQVIRARMDSDSAENTASPLVPVLLSQALIEEFCEQWFATHLHSDEEERDDGLDDADLDDLEMYVAAIEMDARELASRGRKATSFVHIREEAVDWAAAHGYEISDNDPEIFTYVKRFAVKKFEVAKALQARNQGDPVLTPSVPASFIGETLTEYMVIWLRDHVHELHEKTKKIYSIRIVRFCKFLSERYPDIHRKPLRAIEGEHVQAFATYLNKEEILSQKTIKDGYLPALSSIFTYARADGKCLSLPLEHVKLPQLSKQTNASRARPRDAFSVDFLNDLFASSWYGIGDKRILFSPLFADLAARYWVPVIMCAHGFRPIEVCQLTVDDIYIQDNLWCIRISDDFPGQTLKTAATKRGVPVHAKLIELGFEAFIKARQAKAKVGARLFPSLEGREEPAKWFTQAFNRYIRKALSAPLHYTLHSFRHFWEDMRRNAKDELGASAWPKGMHFQISGREDIEKEEGSARDYGHGYTAEAMSPYLNKIWAETLVLPMEYSQFVKEASVPESAKQALKKYLSQTKKREK